MAYLGEAFDIFENQDKISQNIDYFFTQRHLFEEIEIIDKNMNRIIKKKKVIYNFIAINIPIINKIINNNSNLRESSRICKTSKNYDSRTFETNTLNQNSIGFNIEIFGDEGYHYKGVITSFHGIIPNFMIPIKKDKKLFIHIDYKLIDDNQNTSINKFINFIDVPKRFQSIIDNDDNNDHNNNNTYIDS